MTGINLPVALINRVVGALQSTKATGR